MVEPGIVHGDRAFGQAQIGHVVGQRLRHAEQRPGARAAACIWRSAAGWPHTWMSDPRALIA
jgi:hypothetical protein